MNKNQPASPEDKVSQDKKIKEQRLEAIRVAMQQIEKQYGRGSIMRLGESKPQLRLDVIPTGSIALDLALGVGGLPRGRIAEIYGPEASGKTSVCLHIIAEAQKKGGTAAFIDAEHALDPLWAQTIGVNLDDLLLSQPDTGEQALEIAETLIRSGGIDVLIIDSVAALVPRAEIEGEMGDSHMGLQARLMSQALRKLTAVISKSSTVAIFTNQIRHKIGVIFGNPETTPGGLALKFYSSIRMDVRKIQILKIGDKTVGSRHRAKIVKNKVAAPFKMAEFDIRGDEGISREGGIIDLGLDLGIINRSGAFYRFGDDVLGQGKEAAKIFLKEQQSVAGKILAKIKEHFPQGDESKKKK